MTDFNWKKIVGTVAPSIATALGGPLAGMAVGALSKAILGKDGGTEADLAAAMANASPELLLKIKQCEFDFHTKMTELGIDLEKIAADDRANARGREILLRDKTPQILAYGVSIGFFGLLTSLIFFDVATGNRELLNIMLGALGAAWASIIAYFFGSSSGSAEKNRLIGRVLDKGDK